MRERIGDEKIKFFAHATAFLRRVGLHLLCDADFTSCSMLMLTGVFAISSYFIFSMLLSCCRRDNNGLELFFSDRWKLCAESAKMREECEESVEGTDEEERRTLVNKLDVLLIIATINLHAQRIDGYARDVGCYILNDDVVPPTIAIHCRQNFAGFMAF